MHHVHITCQSEALLSLVEALEAQFATIEEVSLLDYGHSQKLVHGYVVLEWLDETDEAFLKQLDADEHVLDYCVYTVSSVDDFPFGSQ